MMTSAGKLIFIEPLSVEADRLAVKQMIIGRWPGWANAKGRFPQFR
jgi:hypothetical protein